ncbi:MAG: hypothetical protein WCE38_19175 [Burkholderiales bacterium]
MKKLTIAVAITALAIAVTMPFTLAQTTSNSDTAQPAASLPGTGPNMMYGQVQSQTQGQGTYGPGMMGGNAQGQGGYGRGMMGGYGVDWMGGYGGIGVLILLVIVVAGLVAWVVTQKRK